MRNEIFNKNGSLSFYGFSCGYVEKFEGESIDKQMYMEYGVYHVQSTKNNTPQHNTIFNGGKGNHNFTIWETFEKLTEAKKFYAKIK